MGGPRSRRHVLSTLSVMGLVALSGCGALSGTRTELAGVQVLNPYYGSVRVDVRIKQAGETIIEEELSVVQADGAETVACSWDRDGDEPIIEVRLADDGDWSQLDLAETDEERVLVQAIVRPERGVRFVVVGEDDDYFVDVCAHEEE